MTGHVVTDPVCLRFEYPRSWWDRRRFDRNRGRACQPCRDAR